MKVTKLINTEVGCLKVNDIFYCDGEYYKILGVGNWDINNVCCKNLETNKMKCFNTTSNVESFEWMINKREVSKW